MSSSWLPDTRRFPSRSKTPTTFSLLSMLRLSRRGSGDLAGRVMDAYLAFTEVMCGWMEQQAEETFGRPIPHILLIHANALNSDGIGALLELLEKRGFGFAALDRVMSDPAYRTSRRLHGRRGSVLDLPLAAVPGKTVRPETRSPSRRLGSCGNSKSPKIARRRETAGAGSQRLFINSFHSERWM